MRFLTLLIAALVLQSIPTAAAVFPLDVDPAPLHTGDQILYRSEIREEIITEPESRYSHHEEYPWQGTIETLVTIEGAAVAADEYGIERDVATFRIERAQDDRLLSVESCHMEPQMGWAMRWDHLEGGPRYENEWAFTGNDPIFGTQVQYYNATPMSDFRREDCDGYWVLPFLWGELFQEGEIIDDRAVPSFELFKVPIWADDSLPGRATTWNGFPAVEYRFPLSTDGVAMVPQRIVSGSMMATFAEGFPGLVAGRIDMEEKMEGSTYRAGVSLEMIGYTAGSEPFPYDIPWREAPDVDPTATFAPISPLDVPDDELGLAYPFDEAFASLRSDPTLGFGAWLAAHPTASIAGAQYDLESNAKGMWFASPLGGRIGVTGPGWELCFADAASEFCAKTVVPAGLDARAAVNEREDPRGHSQGPDAPFLAVSAPDLREAVLEAGIDIGEIRAISYWTSEYDGPEGPAVSATLQVSEVGWSDVNDVAGLIVQLDVVSGAIRSIQAASVEISGSGGVGSPIFSGLQAPRTLSQAPPTVTWEDARNIAPPVVITLTGIALLVFLVKAFLLPLFTRLRGERLLDNPVRARLYERIRAEPGIHLAELEEFLGIGKGATKHHVDQLVSHKLVFVLDVDGYSRCYASGHVPVDVARRVAVLRAGSHARVFELYAARPGLSLREAAKALGMSAPSVHRAKKRLEKEGLLPAAASGPSITLR